MIRIDKVEPKGKDFQVVLEENGEKTTITVHQDVLMRHGLFRKKTLTENERREIEKENAHAKLMQKALDLLALRDHSVASMRRKLKGLAHSEAVESTLSKLKTLGYLNDDLMLERLVDDMIGFSLKGPGAIREKALKEGFHASDVDTALARMDETMEKERLERFVDKEMGRYVKDPIKKKAMKLMRLTVQNGYDMDLARSVIKKKTEAHKDTDHERGLLEKRIETLKDHYNLNDYKSTGKLIQKLMREGFDYEAIKDRLK